MIGPFLDPLFYCFAVSSSGYETKSFVHRFRMNFVMAAKFEIVHRVNIRSIRALNIVLDKKDVQHFEILSKKNRGRLSPML